MTVTHNLDQTFIETQLVCPQGKMRHEFVDPQRSGLYIEVRSGAPGLGTYYLRYKDGNGKTTHEKIGRTTEMTLETARGRAQSRKAALRKALQRTTATPRHPGVNDSIPQAAATDPKPVGITLDAFWTEHYLPHAKTHKRSWWRDEQLYRRLKPKFGHLPLAAIKRLSVEQFQNSLLVDEKLARSTANQHVVLLRRVFNLGKV